MTLATFARLAEGELRPYRSTGSALTLNIILFVLCLFFLVYLCVCVLMQFNNWSFAVELVWQSKLNRMERN